MVLRGEELMNMAIERMQRPDDRDTLTAAEEVSIERARADVEAGRVYSNVTTEALTAFGHLDNAEAQRLLDDPDALRHWLAAHV